VPTVRDKRVAVITGASGGIGAGLVAAYRDRGWAVIANARTIKPAGDPDVLAVEGDVREPVTADNIVGEAIRRFGRIDTLVNDAGVYLSKPFTDYSRDDYDTVVGVNLTGFFILTQRVLTHMLARSSGHIVNMAATIAERPNSAVPAVLTALTKGGVASATRCLALEYAGRGIRVNAVSPGIIQTPLHAPESYASSAAIVPIGRVGQVSDVVEGVMFLEAAAYITGEILHIDGGQVAGH
jgi:NAD(P)-dependent dehydrogenase (short-subunit alcohol dehydrogenase family)